MKKRAIRLLSMLLALLMLTGCSSSILNDPLDRAYRALQRSFISAGRNLVPFDEMEYLRPDMSTISADFDAVNDALESGDIDSVSAALDACYLDYYNFDTMYTLADIRSCQDVYDSYYADEVSWCGENFTAVQQKMEDMFYACAASGLAQELEENYFWDGFTDDYSDRSQSHYSDAVVELMAEGLILPYLDVPFQHAHPRVLKAMKRPASAEKNLERISAWRAVCPDITIRSTFITGFPGETEEEFEYLLDFLREARLDRVGCFAYSPVEGAQANALPGQLPDEVREDRRRRFMEVQAEISSEILRQKVGSVRRVIIDEPEDEDGVAVGRTTADAPDIDGVVYVTTDKHLNPGDFVDVRITDSREHDLIGRHVVSE